MHSTGYGRTVMVAAKNVISGGNLMSVKLLRRPRMLAYYATEALFLLDAIADSRGIPQANVAEVLKAPAVVPINLGGLDTPGVSWFRPWAHETVDIVSLCLICQIIKPRRIFEIGTLNGYTAFHFALNSDPESEVFTLDLPRKEALELQLSTTTQDRELMQQNEEESGYCFQGSPPESKIHCLFGDSAVFNFEPFHKTVDLFFIDGAHSYEYVRSDTENALRCCRSGSVVAWHDFGRRGVNGVSTYLKELNARIPVFSVPGGSLAFALIH